MMVQIEESSSLQLEPGEAQCEPAGGAQRDCSAEDVTATGQGVPPTLVPT